MKQVEFKLILILPILYILALQKLYKAFKTSSPKIRRISRINVIHPMRKVTLNKRYCLIDHDSPLSVKTNP